MVTYSAHYGKKDPYPSEKDTAYVFFGKDFEKDLAFLR
jgi:hypothetical protein